MQDAVMYDPRPAEEPPAAEPPADGAESRAAKAKREFNKLQKRLRRQVGNAIIDYDMIRANPKVLLGYSDATALITAVHVKTGLVTFHGPSPLNVFSAEHFRRVVMNGEAYLLKNPTFLTENTLVQTETRIRTITGGKASGRILGGNLSADSAQPRPGIPQLVIAASSRSWRRVRIHSTPASTRV